MSNKIKQYQKIMHRYYSGEFGKANLYLHQILSLAGTPNLLNEMTFDELSEIILKTENISFKTILTQVRDKKGK